MNAPIAKSEKIPVLPLLESPFLPLTTESDDDRIQRLRCDSQSLSFYGDISRFISKRLVGFETLSLLDIGPRTGAGLALIRLLHHPAAYTRLKFDPVYGIDLDPEFQRIAGQEFKDIHPTVGDIFDLPENSFDVVTCSHTIEHVPDAPAFIKQLEKIARRAVVLACPFEERSPMSDGHINRIDAAFMHELGYHDLEVYDSFHFHNGLCCLAYKAL